ncbi:hypothetical protein VIBNISO65_1350013 [Vibrio nigripulchritudo SO65]|nr:hypothetical protein VIBNIAM115_2030080 [Vibrio nigripulchritudo AM115]CCN44377.1 hypothetical protein VIBNIFTn2_750081 [Vibrio nigripulchritudo FTn2]CCN68114.1 hypothetical protein VIBNIPon4_940081 [Vibrio nigripulchritudo POn4]CCN75374.1 hypothetical protein VIBNISO65_1350013 [Vibrio nigripulchritudo SO65]
MLPVTFMVTRPPFPHLNQNLINGCKINLLMHQLSSPPSKSSSLY